jgi:uncharacterized protein
MKITFCGASSEIGASCILLNIDGKNIVFDSGIRMSQDRLPEFRAIQESGKVDCIIVSHAHTDHTGSLPVLSREFPQAQIFMTHPTKEITRTLLHDSLKIMNYNESEIPVFAENDVLEMLDRIKCFSFSYTFKPVQDSEIKATFFPAGHIAGAACIYVEGKEGTVFYTGDFAVVPQKSVGGADFPKLRPDVLITESTYGDKLHSNRKVEEDKLIEMVKTVIGRGGKILIPAFAVGRAQEVILILRSAVNKGQLPKIPVYVDGMVRNVCAIYKDNPNYLKPELAKRVWSEKDVFYSSEVQPVTDQELRKKIVESEEPCCIIASSGMLLGGYSVFYAEHLAKNERNYIAITGYQDEESPGLHLLNMVDLPRSERVLQLADKAFPVNCDFGKYSLSAHGDKGEILGVIEKLQPRKIFLIHGSPTVIEKLAKDIQTQPSERRREIYIPKNGEEYQVFFHNPRKQLNKSDIVPSLEKNNLPGTEDLEQLWSYLNGFERKRGYTTEELLYIWTGKEFPEEDIKVFQALINESIYFEPEERRLFLYHPVARENLTPKNQDKFMEANKMLSFITEFFPKEAGIYKSGQRFEQKVALIFFDFPAASIPKYSEKIQEFENITGWKVETNSFPNQLAINPLIDSLLGKERNLLIKVSYNPVQNYLNVSLANKPADPDLIISSFKEITGMNIEITEKLITSVEQLKKEELKILTSIEGIGEVRKFQKSKKTLGHQ